MTKERVDEALKEARRLEEAAIKAKGNIGHLIALASGNLVEYIKRARAHNDETARDDTS